MSKKTVQALVDRMANEPEFAALVHGAPDEVLGEAELSAEEREEVLASAAAIAEGTESEVSGFDIGDRYEASLRPPKLPDMFDNSRVPLPSERDGLWPKDPGARY